MRTAVCTFGFGRPDHFKRMLQGLADCPEVMNGEVDLHHYLDGGEHSLQAELVKVINDSGVPYKKIIQRPENFGVGRQLIGARREIFDEQNYERMILVEDDIEAGPTFMTALLRLSDWAEGYDDVGTVQVWNVQSGTKQQLEGDLDKVVLTNRHFVTYCLTKKTWDLISPSLYEYEKKYLLGRAYGNRPHRRIRLFQMRKMLKASRRQPQGNCLNPPAEACSHPFPKIDYRRSPTSQDAITSIALHQAGLHRLTTEVSRAFYFGETGVHCTPEVYRQLGFHLQGHHAWDSQSEPTSFELKYKDKEGNWLHSLYR